MNKNVNSMGLYYSHFTSTSRQDKISRSKRVYFNIKKSQTKLINTININNKHA